MTFLITVNIKQLQKNKKTRKELNYLRKSFLIRKYKFHLKK